MGTFKIKCDKCAHAVYFPGALPRCYVSKCDDFSEFVPRNIPVNWIEEQIKKNPGRHASSWSYLIDIWKSECLKGVEEEKSEDDYIRMHQDQTAAQKFWRNE